MDFEEATIVVIDDVQDQLDIMTEILETNKSNVITKFDPSTLDGIDWSLIDLVITDHDMTHLNSKKVIEIIRSHNKATKVIICSARESGEFSSLNPDGIIKKPYSVRTFIDKVKEVLETI